MYVEGTTYLLAQEENGVEYVVRYGREEMEEVFTLAERTQLVGGETVLKTFRLGSVRFVDMVGAAREVRKDA